jgi:hypothetical protein
MGFSQWFGQHWFTSLQSVAIIAGLLFNATALRADAKSRRVNNLLTITANHRQIWTQFYQQPELKRVLDSEARLDEKGLTREEELFTRFVILHLNSAFHAIKNGMLMTPDGLRRDAAWFFSLPIPASVWERVKLLQDRDFAQFVEQCKGNDLGDQSDANRSKS